MTAALFVSLPNPVFSAYLAFFVVIAAGLASIVLRESWRSGSGFDKLLLLGPLFYAAPLSAFGTEHFSFPTVIAAMVPKWVPGHMFWTYFVGSCFIAAGLSLATGIQTRLTSGLVAITFFLFVALMDAPAYARHPSNWLFGVLALRQLAFSGGALAYYASLSNRVPASRPSTPGTIARYFVAVPLVVYAVEQFLHHDHVPGIPLEKLTPAYVPAHAIWSYFCAVIYVIAGVLLLSGKKVRIASLAAGLTVLIIELIVYVPIAVVERASIVGFNYMADTLMFCGAVLLLARAMRREA